MKKIVIAVITLLASYGLASAQNVKATQGTNKSAPNYVDKNNDGICDNFNTVNRGGRARNNGTCMYGSGRQSNTQRGNASVGKGRNLVDKNNNGICDYRE